jgi:predicted metal-dependent phosphoesterase TrpH
MSRDKWDFNAWKEAGLEGLEVFYPSHNEAMRQELLQLAREYVFFATGGSDTHGDKSGRSSKPGVEIPQKYYEVLLETFGLKGGGK